PAPVVEGRSRDLQLSADLVDCQLLPRSHRYRHGATSRLRMDTESANNAGGSASPGWKRAGGIADRHMRWFLAMERAGRQSGINNAGSPRVLGGGIAVSQRTGAADFRAAAGGSRSFSPCVFAALPTASATAPPPSTAAANTLNGRHDRRFG